MRKLNKGLYVVIVTPFNEAGEIDQTGLRHNIDWYIEVGASGIICTGSTGSFDALSDEERKDVIRITAEQVSGRATVLAGTAATTTEKTVELSKYAESVGMDGVMIVPPYYSIPTEVELYEHYKDIANAINIPIMIYNNPRRTGVDLSPRWLSTIASEIENITHVKESSGDIRRVHQILRFSEGNLTVFIGIDDISFYGLIGGARGWVASSSNIIPEHALRLVKAVEEGDLNKATDIFNELLPIFSFVESSGKLVPVCKAGVEMRGHVGGGIRKPNLPITKEEKKELAQLLENLNLY
jgi:4-hydroxy-tetrahydrodipicolinate synthase